VTAQEWPNFPLIHTLETLFTLKFKNSYLYVVCIDLCLVSLYYPCPSILHSVHNKKKLH
jgi:hypothetical protein